MLFHLLYYNGYLFPSKSLQLSISTQYTIYEAYMKSHGVARIK